ncbi:hypothetical protein OV079_14600 [Nannocystis pusilla]|uniref:Uncharacterized protein n=1 Tax=Nannocystis pusilla TaxID=889268 RepID=A0A9X3IX95_9BACT|nr:hypothetical protein [Nannocystis pusilla]MCY1006760.1 hypothetical protein [Nannocystis pusilla]
MAMISRKKRPYRVQDGLRGYLRRHSRLAELPVSYADLTRYDDATPVYDKRGRDTLWQSVLYPPSMRKEIHRDLVRTYANMRVMGNAALMQHLITDRVDVCTYGNTQPFRVRILNTLNENFDYFYVKHADASRLYGLELEDLLSPSRIQYLTDGVTLIEEHIAGIPGDQFIREHLGDSRIEAVRLAKEFVKFNERCFVRLLGDMHSSNFVVNVIPDLDEVMVRIRAIDFDQQSYEGRCNVYMPKYYSQNNAVIFLAMSCMTHESVKQYQEEEHALLRLRARAEHEALGDLLHTMSDDDLAPVENIQRLRQELAHHHRDDRFLRCESMGELVRASLSLLDWE